MSQFFGGALDPTWPHAILIAGSIIGGALVGLGVILEAPKILSIPVAAVFLGIVIEAACTLLLFGFDEGISSKQQETIEAQRTQIIALEKQLALPELSSDELTAFKAAVSPYKDRTISVWSYGLDLEGSRLAHQLLVALNDAKMPTVDSVGHMLGSITPRIGVIITGPDDELIAALLLALKSLSPTRGPLPGGYRTQGEPIGAQQIVPAEIFVGLKPLPK
jgi:hypothetical protein